MTFILLRAGLPNSIVAIALAALPIVALALSPAQRAPHASVQSADVVAGSEAGSSSDQAVFN
jgi:hypothetical protein